MTIKSILSEAEARLTSLGVPGARLDTHVLMGHVLHRNRAWILAHDMDELSPAHQREFEGFVEQRAARIPVVHLTKTREFYKLDLFISEAVLTPRVETEQMVDWAIKYAKPGSRLVDIGTGSGALAIAIAVHRPDLHITATEISPEALLVAQDNAKRHNVKIEFVLSDLWAALDESFDTIVTNLPYLRDDADLMPEVKREPAVALFGGTDGLDLYRRFIDGIDTHLTPQGYLFTECDPWQHEALIDYTAEHNLAPIENGYFVLGFQKRELSTPPPH